MVAEDSENEAGLRKIPASEILDKITKSKPVEYDHIRIEGDLDLTKLDLLELDLPTEYDSQTKFGRTNTKTSEKLKVVIPSIAITNSKFVDRVNFGKCQFEDTVNFENTTFIRGGIFERARFKGYANFAGAMFRGNADFGRAEFSVDVNFRGANFDGNDAIFERAIFFGYANFVRAKFRGNANFSVSDFNGYSDFTWSSFDKNADFSVSNFVVGARFYRSKFKEFVSFYRSKFKYADFGYSKFSERVDFRLDEYSSSLDFTGSEFSQPADFPHEPKETRYIKILTKKIKDTIKNFSFNKNFIYLIFGLIILLIIVFAQMDVVKFMELQDKKIDYFQEQFRLQDEQQKNQTLLQKQQLQLQEKQANIDSSLKAIDLAVKSGATLGEFLIGTTAAPKNSLIEIAKLLADNIKLDISLNKNMDNAVSGQIVQGSAGGNTSLVYLVTIKPPVGNTSEDTVTVKPLESDYSNVYKVRSINAIAH